MATTSFGPYRGPIKNIVSGQSTYYYRVVINGSVTDVDEKTARVSVSSTIEMSYVNTGSGVSPTAPVDYWLAVGESAASMSYVKKTVLAGNIPTGTTPASSSALLSAYTRNFTVTKAASDDTNLRSYLASANCLYDSSETSLYGANVTIPPRTKYTVSYNANGGSGAPGSQTKWYDVALTLSTTKPSRLAYGFSGWATSSGGSVVYASGGKYTANAGAALYAVWTPDAGPTITNLKCERCTSTGALSDEGTYAKITATYKATTTHNSSNRVTSAVATLGSVTNTKTLNAVSGSYSVVIGTFTANNPFSGSVVFTDDNGRSTTVSLYLPVASYPIDVAYIKKTVGGVETEGYSVGIMGPASSTMDRVSLITDDVYIGNGINANLMASTTGRNGRVMLVKGVDGYGASIELGAGGLTVVGGGESAASLYSEYVTNGTVTGGAEQLWLGADTEVSIFSNCQTVTDGVIDGEHRFRFSNAGNIILGGALYFGDVNDPDDGTYRAHLNATDGAIYLTGDQTASGVKAQIRILNATGKIGTRVYDGSAWGSWHDFDPSSIVVGTDIVLYPANSDLIRFVLTSGGNFRLDKRSSASIAWSDSSVEHFYAPMGNASTSSHTANTVYAAPNGSAGTASFRKLVAADLPVVTVDKMASPYSHHTSTRANIEAITNGTAPTAVNTAGWNYDVYSDGTVHAWGVVRVQNQAISTKLADGMYWNATEFYIAPPVAIKHITNEQWGYALGGSPGWGAYAAPSGNGTSIWTSTSAKYSIPFHIGRPTSSSSGNWWFPVDIRYSKA